MYPGFLFVSFFYSTCMLVNMCFSIVGVYLDNLILLCSVDCTERCTCNMYESCSKAVLLF